MDLPVSAFNLWATETAGWFAVRVPRTKVDRIDIAGLFLLGARIHALLGLKTGSVIAEVLPILADADEYLEKFLNVNVGPRAEQTRPAARELQKELTQITRVPPRLSKAGIELSIAGQINDELLIYLRKLVEQFEAVLCSESSLWGVFYLTPKRAYSTEHLTQSGGGGY